MVKKSRSSVLGFTKLRNQVKRNAFDLSHRHMFTAQPGELLPIFSQWVNPNESFKIGYSGLTRTAPLNTAAFTRLRENVQYFFVPFQSLWRYFEQVVNNMTSGQAGQEISMFASSPVLSSKLSTKLPYVNYDDLRRIIKLQYEQAVRWCSSYFHSLTSSPSQLGFYDYVSRQDRTTTDLNEHFNAVFFNREYRYVATGKLLNALGYGNFSKVITHDVFAAFWSYYRENMTNFSDNGFLASSYSLQFKLSYSSSPNLSILPLLAYHKVVNDFYRLRNWQSYQSWTSNVDYLAPSSSMDIMSQFKDSDFGSLAFTMFDLEYSNLPVDYFTGVLPRSQYGDESAVPVNAGLSTVLSISNPRVSTPGSLTSGSTVNIDEPAALGHSASLKSGTAKLTGLTGTIGVSDNPVSADFKISSLRSAVALQKYKEIQNSNDWSFEEQVLAHFGVKPSCDIHKSRFIGGSDATIDINPQVNQAFSGLEMPEIKAIGTGNLSCTLNFKSDTYGIILGIYRCVPQLDYAHVGIDRNLYKTDASDFPLPELDSIGMQTQYRSEVYAPPIGGSDPNVELSSTYGYAPRYAELKTSFDRYDGGFNGAFSDWVTGLNADYFSDGWLNLVDTSSPSSLDVTDILLCSPSLLYPLFVNQWSGTANDDKLLVGSVNSCTAVRPFSVHGLPWSN